jgi:hypothetical protein
MRLQLPATNLAATAVGVSMILAPSTARGADDEAPARRSTIECWVGAKFGSAPGELVRGWTCIERRAPETTTADQAPHAQADALLDPGAKDVATGGGDTASRR